MPTKPIVLSSARKLKTLRALDVFHSWASLDDARFCRRCGEIINGHTVQVFADRRGAVKFRLECPTAGCPSVPIEWMVLECPSPAQGADAQPPVPERGRFFRSHARPVLPPLAPPG